MEEQNYYESLKAGLEDAVAFINGDRSRGKVVVRGNCVPEYKANDVARTRKDLNMSQRALANALGVSTRTVEAWEAGKNEPSGAARHLLFLLDNDHTLVQRLIFH